MKFFYHLFTVLGDISELVLGIAGTMICAMGGGIRIILRISSLSFFAANSSENMLVTLCCCGVLLM